jgi:hypothetical protein
MGNQRPHTPLRQPDLSAQDRHKRSGVSGQNVPPGPGSPREDELGLLQIVRGCHPSASTLTVPEVQVYRAGRGVRGAPIGHDQGYWPFPSGCGGREAGFAIQHPTPFPSPVSGKGLNRHGQNLKEWTVEPCLEPAWSVERNVIVARQELSSLCCGVSTLNARSAEGRGLNLSNCAPRVVRNT